MAQICPICNGIEKISLLCPVCGKQLEDKGMVEDYAGPYSPYADGLILTSAAAVECIHIAYCANCGIDMRVAYRTQNM